MIDAGAAIETAAAEIRMTEMEKRGQSQPSNSSSLLLQQACLRYHWEAPSRSFHRRNHRKHRQAKAQRLPLDVNQRLQQPRSKRQEEADGCLTRRVPTHSYETPSRKAPITLLSLTHATSTYMIQAELPTVT